MANYNDLTDDEDFLELVEHIVVPRAPRQYQQRPNHFAVWTENQFIARFRLSKAVVTLITEEIEPVIRNNSERNHALAPIEMVLLTLRFLATGSFLQVVGDCIGIDKSIASRIVHKVIRAIASLRPQFINMPSTPMEISRVKQEFYSIARFPHYIGALDCTHVKIQSPGGEQPELFRNRKQYFSYNVQAVCDASLKFLDVVCRWPGSAHDSNIFANSIIRAKLENFDFGSNSVIVGDSGYGIKPYLITPLRHPQTQSENLFNESQIRTRNPIERCFGVLKRRFPVLALGIRLNQRKVEAVVLACTVLQNIAIEMGENMEFEYDEEVEAEIALALDINQDVVEENREINVNNIVRHRLISNHFAHLL